MENKNLKRIFWFVIYGIAIVFILLLVFFLILPSITALTFFTPKMTLVVKEIPATQLSINYQEIHNDIVRMNNIPLLPD